eukprot:COSAG01_NODE_1_length_100484_cov_170.446142_32_plen_254_part_00
MLTKLFYTLYSCWAWVFIASAFPTHAIVSKVLCFFSKDKERTCYWSCVPILKFGFFVSRVKVTVSGVENLPESGPLVLLSNHQSHLDILSFLIASPLKLSFFAKEELLKIPLLGSDIKQQGHFWVDRRNARKASKQLKIVKEKIKAGKSVLVFPGGTRSPEGEVGSFKRGAFQMALETGAPILPACITGSAHVLSKGNWQVKPGHIHIHFDPMIQPKIEENISKQAKAMIPEYEAKLKTLLQKTCQNKATLAS